MTDDHRGDELFLAYLIGQELRRHEYEAKVNALVAAGQPMGDARTIVNAWYALHAAPRYHPAIWQFAAWACAMAAISSLGSTEYVATLIWLALGGLGLLRANYCDQATSTAQGAAAQARITLARYGQL